MSIRISVVIFCHHTSELALSTLSSITETGYDFLSIDLVTSSSLSGLEAGSAKIHSSGDDYFSCFELLSKVMQESGGTHTLLVPSGFLLSQEFIEHFTEQMSAKSVCVFEADNKNNWWLAPQKKECLSEILSEPIVFPVVGFSSETKHVLDSRLAFLALWDFIIGLVQEAEADFIHQVNPPGLSIDPLFPKVPLEGYYHYLQQKEPLAASRLPYVHDEWVQLLCGLKEQLISKRKILFSQNLSGILPKVQSRFESLKLEYARHLPENIDSASQPKAVNISQVNAKHLSPKLLLESSDFSANGSHQKLKLLFLTRHCPFEEITGPIAAGAELSMRRIAEQMVKLGHEVHYVSFPDLRGGDFEINGVHVHLLSYQQAQGSDLSSVEGAFTIGRKVAEGITLQNQYVKKAFGVSAKVLGMDPQNRWRYRRFVEDICKSHSIDLIHCFSSAPDSVACAIVSNKLNIPLMLRMGGRFWYLKYQSLECPHRRQKYLEDINYAFQVTDCLAFNSHFIREESFRLFDELAIPYKSAETVVDIGVCPIIGTQESNLHNGLKKSDDELIISCVGKFKKFSKRQDLLVEAFARLPDCSNLRLVFAGDGPEMEAVRSIAKDRGVEQRVEFLGSISQADVYKLLELSDVFVHPTEFEGSSKAVAEAMSVGAAVLASNIPPNAEHISHEGNGLLAENTIESFLEQLQRICSDEPLRNELSASALNYAQDHFRPEINALHYQALFYELCRSGKLSKLKNKRRFVA